MAYCSRCGTKIEENTKFCPSCGTQIIENVNQTSHAIHSHDSDMGKLIVSTKIGAKMKAVLAVCCIIEFLLGIFMIFSIGILQKALDSTLGGLFLGLIPGTLCVCYPVWVIIGHKSYCAVHENGIIGMTGLNLSKLNAPMQKFSVTYDEIINITESSRALLIYTQYTTYEVLARENRKEALEEIKHRMLRNPQ